MTKSASPSISVVIPAYNSAAFLGETVESVLNSRGVDCEIVIVDDGSTDSTYNIALQYSGSDPQQFKALSQKNAGVSAARNAGFDLASAPLICFLDADDQLRPGALAALKELLDGSPQAVAAYGNVSYVDLQSKPLPIGETAGAAKPSGKLLSFILEGNLIDTPGAILFRKSAIDQAGGFKPGLRRSQDWEFYVRIAARGEILSTPQTVLDYRLHQNSVSHEASTVQTFDPAIKAAFDFAREEGSIDPKTLRILEYRRRASTIRLMALRGKRLSLANAASFLRLCLNSGFDTRVVTLTVTTILSVLKYRLTHLVPQPISESRS